MQFAPCSGHILGSIFKPLADIAARGSRERFRLNIDDSASDQAKDFSATDVFDGDDT
jgi:hypothetical protein